MRNLFIRSLVIVSVLLLPLTCFAVPTVEYVGSSTVGKFMHEAAKVYTNVNFSINTGPESGGGEKAIATDLADLGGVAREVKPAILDKGIEKFLIGKDAIGVWVNRANPVTSLTKDQLKGIFTGKIGNWKEVGGRDAPIVVYIVNKNSATRKVFAKTILGGEKYGSATTVRPDPAIIEKVGADSNGIGQLSFALGAGHPDEGKVKKVDVGSEKASVDNPSYPITRPLYLITNGAPEGEVKDFIDWSLSDEGQAVVKIYFVGK